MAPHRFSDEQVKQLLRRALSGDEGSWKALFEGLYGLLKSQAIRAGLDDEDVEDAAGDSLALLVESAREFLEARDTISYLSASAYYAALRLRTVRGRIRDREVSDDSMAAERAMSFGDDPAHRSMVLSGEVARALVAAADGLREPVRSQVLLHYGEDLSYEEIAYVCGGAPGGIRVAVHRALKNIRGSLEAVLDEVLPGASIGRALREVRLPPVARPMVEPVAGRLLDAWITSPDQLSAQDRRAVEERLATDSAYRLLRVLAERRLAGEDDVRGHAEEPGGIPPALLHELMAHARSLFGRSA